MGDDPNCAAGDQRTEAISAVQDDDHFDYDDYDDLYNDVNVGDAFHHSANPEPKPDPSVPLPDSKPEFATAVAPAAPPPAGFGFQSQNPSEVGPPRPPPPMPRPDHGQFSGKPPEIPVQIPVQYSNPNFGNNEGFPRGGGGGGGTYNNNNNNNSSNINNNTNNNGNGSSSGGGGGGTILFVGDLHWWTTDADLEVELYKYGQVKEVRFFDEKASGKSKGYCQVEFYVPMAAAACKEGMNGHLFNGRPCVVAFASPYSVRRMGEAQTNKNQGFSQNQPAPPQGRGGRAAGGVPPGGGRGGNWGRGGPGGGRGQMGNVRNRMGPGGGRGIMGNGGMINPLPPPVMNPGNMFAQGFDPMGGYGNMMGRMGGGYGGFPGAPAPPPFTGMFPSFPTMVAPHVNPAFFGRGMAPGGGPGMWQDPNASGWGAEEQSSYGEDAASDQQYGDGGNHGKDRASDRDWAGGSERKHHNDRESDMGYGHEMPDRKYHDDRDVSRDREREREKDRDRGQERERDRERDRYHDDRERHGDNHRKRERESYRDDDWDRGRSSKTRSKSRELEYSKRYRVTPE